jgi:hypothetical protein
MTPASLIRTNDVVSNRKGSSACAGGDIMIRDILSRSPDRATGQAHRRRCGVAGYNLWWQCRRGGGRLCLRKHRLCHGRRRGAGERLRAGARTHHRPRRSSARRDQGANCRHLLRVPRMSHPDVASTRRCQGVARHFDMPMTRRRFRRASARHRPGRDGAARFAVSVCWIRHDLKKNCRLVKARTPALVRLPPHSTAKSNTNDDDTEHCA